MGAFNTHMQLTTITPYGNKEHTMANIKLPASAEFFKQLSIEYQQLKIVIQLIETFAFRATVRGHELGDSRLLLILEQLEVLVLKAQQLIYDLEKRLCSADL